MVRPGRPALQHLESFASEVLTLANDQAKVTQPVPAIEIGFRVVSGTVPTVSFPGEAGAERSPKQDGAARPQGSLPS